jgi:PTS system mannose-specific IIA component
MIGIVVVAHGNIGCEMVAATHRIIPEAKHLIGVAVESNNPPQSIRQQISDAIAKVGGDDGVLILTDMFGGTPSNICLSFLNQERVEVISGVNLPMLIKLANLKGQLSFDDTVPFIQQYGQRNIVIASHVLDGRTKKTGT